MATAVTKGRFDLSGGHLALDLANTKSRRRTPEPREDLRSYEDLVAWGLEGGAIDASAAAALRAQAARRPRAARAALVRARDLREAVFEVFSAVAGKREIPQPALERVNAALADALARLRLERTGGKAAWSWAEGDHIDRVTWPAVRAAALLLTAPDLAHVRECAARDCAWLFLDTSRNGTRRWCDMAVCGNREKARRFQRRARGSRGSSRR
jgi:predicted RNA-binding Zn ribbon-like protein